MNPEPATRSADYQPDAHGRLSLYQKRRLVLLARRAFNKQGRPGGDFDTWRREIALRACGLRISEADQRDWAALKAAYLDAAGDSGRAFETLMREDDNKRRIAMHKLVRACTERGLPLAYPEAICRRQYRCCLGEASAPQLWRLVFTVKNRRKAKAA